MRQPGPPEDMLAHYYGHDGHIGSCDLSQLKKFYLLQQVYHIFGFTLDKVSKKIEMFVKNTDRCLFPLLLT